MINLIEIKDRKLIFITNNTQLKDFINLITKDDSYLQNQVIILDPYYKYYTKYLSAFMMLLMQFRRRNVSVIGFCNDRNMIDKRFQYMSGRFVTIGSHSLKEGIIKIYNACEGTTKYLKGEL